MRLALIDHYDSFTFNVIEWLARSVPHLDLLHIAFDDSAALDRLTNDPLPLILSPGPKRPDDAPLTLAVLQKLTGRVPILGICLGAQMLAHTAGAKIARAKAPFHGSTRRIAVLESNPLLGAAGTVWRAAVYNSLTVDVRTLPSPWRALAVDEQDELQALVRFVPGEAPAYGLQFHPESFLSDGCEALAVNWLEIVRQHMTPEAPHASATLPLSMPS